MKSSLSHLFNLDILLILELWSPEGQIISNELHDGGGILVLLLLDVLNISDGIIESLFSQIAGLGWVIHNFVVEDGEVQG